MTSPYSPNLDEDTGDLAERQYRVEATIERRKELEAILAERKDAKLPRWYKTALTSASAAAVIAWLILVALVAGHDGGRLGPILAVWIAVAAVMTLVVTVGAVGAAQIHIINQRVSEWDQIAEWRHEEDVSAQTKAARDAGYWKGCAQTLKDMAASDGAVVNIHRPRTNGASRP